MNTFLKERNILYFYTFFLNGVTISSPKGGKIENSLVVVLESDRKLGRVSEAMRQGLDASYFPSCHLNFTLTFPQPFFLMKKNHINILSRAEKASCKLQCVLKHDLVGTRKHICRKNNIHLCVSYLLVFYFTLGIISKYYTIIINLSIKEIYNLYYQDFFFASDMTIFILKKIFSAFHPFFFSFKNMHFKVFGYLLFSLCWKQYFLVFISKA